MQGFVMIEMLVALLLLSLVTASTYELLNSVVKQSTTSFAQSKEIIAKVRCIENSPCEVFQSMDIGSIYKCKAGDDSTYILAE